jgi:membrane protein
VGKLPFLVGAATAAAVVKHARRDDGAPAADGAHGGPAVLDGVVPEAVATARAVDVRTEEERAAAGARGEHASTPAEIPKRGWFEIIRRALKETSADRVPMMASAVAFAGLLSLFPAILASVSIYGLVVDPMTAADHADAVAAALPSDAAELLTEQIRNVASAERSTLGLALLTSVLAALWSASGGMGMLLGAINVAYDEQDDRGFVKNKALALGLTLAAILFLAVAITLIAVVPAVIEAVGLGVVGTALAQVARWALLAVMMAAALAALYRVGPDRADARWAWISPGAVLAAGLWLLGSALFSLFVSRFGSYQETYGTFAGFVVLMLWLQITALVILIGAEVNAEAERQTVVDTTTGPPKPMGLRDAVPADDPPPPPGQRGRPHEHEAAGARS